MRKLSLILVCIFVYVTLEAQYTDTLIQTPNGTSVEAKIFTSSDMTNSQKEDAKNFWLSCYNNRITYIAEATYKYNCHAFAWHVSEGGNQVWINTPNDDKYWEDYSYVEVSNTSEATKISFGGPCYQVWTTCNGTEYQNPCDHSATTTNVTDYFISKWGASPRFKHHKNDCPYSTEDLHYYIRLSISGPSTICDQAEYEIPTLPNGAIVEWSLAHTGSGAYPQLIQNTPEPNKCTIINPHRYPLTTTLTANIMINGTNVISLNKTVTSMGNSAVQYGHFFQQGCVVNGITQKTRSGSFSSDSYFYLNQGCLAEITLYDMAGRSVLFHSGYPPGYWSYNSSNSKLLVRPAVGSSGVPTSFKITGGCQDRSLMYFTYSLSEGSMTLSPNPASDFVTVSVNDSERGEFKLLDSDNLILESVSSLTSSYEIQLWNSFGLIKQVTTDQKSYQLDLTGVPPGFYYVHVIKDGQTYRRQLVVQ